MYGVQKDNRSLTLRHLNGAELGRARHRLAGLNDNTRYRQGWVQTRPRPASLRSQRFERRISAHYTVICLRARCHRYSHCRFPPMAWPNQQGSPRDHKRQSGQIPQPHADSRPLRSAATNVCPNVQQQDVQDGQRPYRQPGQPNLGDFSGCLAGWRDTVL